MSKLEVVGGEHVVNLNILEQTQQVVIPADTLLSPFQS